GRSLPHARTIGPVPPRSRLERFTGSKSVATVKTPGFVHLRLRSEYSISDSIVRIGEAVKAAVADGQPALALTDSANLFGWVRFYKAALAQGVQPICGIDCWITNPDDRDRPHRLLL